MKTQRKPSRALSNTISSLDEAALRRAKQRMQIAVTIADALEEKHISQKQFAAMMGKTESEISDWLSGDRNFTVNTLSDIGDCLGISFFNTNSANTTNSAKNQRAKKDLTLAPVC